METRVIKLKIYETGKITVIMGASGSGKTTLLRNIAQDNSNSYTIFQGGKQLFPWFSLQKNCELTCKLNYHDLLDKWNLKHLLNRKPTQVSGGEEQRYVLTNAICSGAELLLCDEPLSALDTNTSNIICKDFCNVVKEMQLSVVWVTHNPLEASLIADKLYIIRDHKILNYNGKIELNEIIKQI